MGKVIELPGSIDELLDIVRSIGSGDDPDDEHGEGGGPSEVSSEENSGTEWPMIIGMVSLATLAAITGMVFGPHILGKE